MWTETLIAVCRREGIPFSEMEPMKAHTTFKIGGPARVMAMPGTVGQIAALMQGGFPLVFVGRGSNLLVADAGIDGAVVLSELSMMRGSAVLAFLCRDCEKIVIDCAEGRSDLNQK